MLIPWVSYTFVSFSCVLKVVVERRRWTCGGSSSQIMMQIKLQRSRIVKNQQLNYMFWFVSGRERLPASITKRKVRGVKNKLSSVENCELWIVFTMLCVYYTHIYTHLRRMMKQRQLIDFVEVISECVYTASGIEV